MPSMGGARRDVRPRPRARLAPAGIALAGAVVVTAALAGCLPPPPPPPPPPTTTTAPLPPGGTVRLLLDAPAPAGGYQSFANQGTATVAITVAASNGGTLRAAAGRSGGAGDRAVRFPAHSAAAAAPRAVIRIRGGGAGDALDPGTGRIAFGADVLLDTTSQSAAAGSSDNGDNVVQRGLFDDVSQYKIQVDAGRPSCRIKGAAGELLVISTAPMARGRWYRLACTRDGATVTLTVTSWSAAGVARVVTTRATGPTGDLGPAAPTVPLSVGGKLRADGTLVPATDQFNGLVDNVILRIG